MARGRKSGGPKSGGRPKGSKNKLSIGRVSAAVRSATPSFDPLEQLEIIGKTFLDAAKVEIRKTRPNQKHYHDLLDRAARMMEKMMPYKHPRLSSVTLGGDKNNPIRLEHLSDAELSFMRRTMLKATGGQQDGE